MNKKNKREPEINQEYCHKDNCTTLTVVMYSKEKGVVTYRHDGQQYTKSLAQFSKLVAKRDKK